MARFFSGHDPYHVHALLGLLCLASFVYSYTTMSVMPVQWVPHVLLSCSSLVFSVPAKRISRNPTIIYRVPTPRHCVYVSEFVHLSCSVRAACNAAADCAGRECCG